MKDETKQLNNLELEEELVCKNYGLVVSQALSFSNENSQFLLEDYIHVGLIGLLKAIREYKEDKAKFSTFATACIRNHMLNLLRRTKNKSSVIFDSDYLSTSQIDKENFFEYVPDYLSEEHKFIIKLKLQNYNNREIREMISCTKKQLEDKMKEITKALRGCGQ